MSVTRKHRSLIAWGLYACMVFSALVCSISHGQQNGLELNGAGSLFCSLDGHGATKVPGGFGESRSSGLMPGMDCPLCSAMILGVAILAGLSWLLRRSGKTFSGIACSFLPSSRVTWPPANPRAP
jgi:hypothetical protein